MGGQFETANNYHHAAAVGEDKVWSDGYQSHNWYVNDWIYSYSSNERVRLSKFKGLHILILEIVPNRTTWDLFVGMVPLHTQLEPQVKLILLVIVHQTAGSPAIEGQDLLGISNSNIF